VSRILRLQKEREQIAKQHQAQVDKLRKESQVGVVSFSDKFSAAKSVVEEQLKHETVGFHTLDEFQKKRLKVEAQERLQERYAVTRCAELIHRQQCQEAQDRTDQQEQTVLRRRRGGRAG
jgi:rubrerythrin